MKYRTFLSANTFLDGFAHPPNPILCTIDMYRFGCFISPKPELTISCFFSQSPPTNSIVAAAPNRGRRLPPQTRQPWRWRGGGGARGAAYGGWRRSMSRTSVRGKVRGRRPGASTGEGDHRPSESEQSHLCRFQRPARPDNGAPLQ